MSRVAFSSGRVRHDEEERFTARHPSPSAARRAQLAAWARDAARTPVLLLVSSIQVAEG